MRPLLPLLLAVLPSLTRAEPLRIVTDIAPVHSLISQIAGDAAEVELLVDGASSAHHFQFTFRQAEALQTADLIIWMGPALTPWLDDALTSLAPEAAQLTLLEAPGWTPLTVQDRTAEADHADDHDHSHDHAHNHEAGQIDPHAWLDPQIAAHWVQHVQDALVTADPDNAERYAQNAETTRAKLEALDTRIAAQLAVLPDRAFVVPHDAFQYFGARYDRPAAGVVTLVDDQPPTPDRLAALQNRVRSGSIACVLTDIAASDRWTALLTEGTDVRTATVDPLGRTLDPGPDHYENTLTALADAYSSCIGD
ncbi:zinc ABC transporter substrate-binding protein [Thalassorhabdomicrobium marinisediminis]|uniref:High-affinity zinc uptake system protein ZnuA n=1 Tax=Thalassorhabdomicrobium marinisediminis TaxID=2170577 RepID=A0A2T7FXE8_9RHOB|nr:zinc ABC transporter substrate-binding protein [Thalassorhabdomicrobium marinisediminis]PVA06845.1 zinc ABC transporter substrate-binding protein [Thalassorhabdomicrobium marinisediminis]